MFDAKGFVFFTNYSSRKAKQIANNSKVSLLFPWQALGRQVKVTGEAAKISTAESMKYFATRPRGSQIGAWASHQSQAMDGWAELEKRVAFYTAKFHLGPVPRPEFWSGFRLRAERFEFWKQGNFRLHKRFVFTPSAENTEKWDVQQVFP